MPFRKAGSGILALLPVLLLCASLRGSVLARPSNAPSGPQEPGAVAIPTHPKELKYGELKFDVPKAESYRYRLKNGIPAYVAEDHSLPLVRIQVMARVGSFLDPPEKTGLAEMTGEMLRQGGTARLAAEEFDEKADFLAAEISSSTGDTHGGASLDCLSSVLEPSLDLFFEMLRSPRFQQSRFEVQKGNWLEEMKQRNDDAGKILRREFDWLIFGEDHFSTRQATARDLEAISREDLVDFHRKCWLPEKMILAVSGDVNRKDILAALDRRFAEWKSGGPAPPWPPPPPHHVPKPGLYHVEKDIPQGKVQIGHLGTKWDHWDDPDNFALMVMNDILGGGGFTARLVKKVRSDEGLAYHVGSSFGIGTFWPGQFSIVYQSKNATVALAAKISLAEVKRLREEPVSEDEMTVAKSSFIDTFPRNFESPVKIARTFAEDEYLGRPHSYWETYRDNIRKVTTADVQRVAKKYLDPGKLVILVVGKWSEIEAGDPGHRASMKELSAGDVVHLPLRDPLTLKPPS